MSQNRARARARARAQRSGTRDRIERHESLVFDYEHEHRRKRLSTSTEIAKYFTIAHGYLVPAPKSPHPSPRTHRPLQCAAPINFVTSPSSEVTSTRTRPACCIAAGKPWCSAPLRSRRPCRPGWRAKARAGSRPSTTCFPAAPVRASRAIVAERSTGARPKSSG